MSGWYKPRKPIAEYPETSQQQKVKVAGKVVAKLCKGKKKGEFYTCRHEILDCLFHDGQCNPKVMEAMREVEQQQKNH